MKRSAAGGKPGQAAPAAAQLVLLDLDGTVHQAGVPVPGAVAALARLRADGHVLRLCTNTDSQSTGGLLSQLGAMGIAVGPGELLTPVTAARRVLGQSAGARALLLVSREVSAELGEACETVPPEHADRASHVVVGDYRDSLSYAALDAAFRAVRSGARLLALQRGRYFRAADGPHLDTGAVVAAIEYAAEVTATVLGKPSPEFLRTAIESAPRKFPASATWIIGDDRSTDIAMAQAAGLRSAQPRTGKHADQATQADLPAPEFVIGSVADLPDLLAESG